MGHRRLAIVDLKGGAQPLAGRREGLWLVGDGQIYNHDRLRSELGHVRFRTRSDHEAALHLYDEQGVGSFERLWGAFAIAIAGEDGRFVATRDTFGVSPLYWARRGDTVLFASALVAFEEEWRVDVRPFPPGHAWAPEGGLTPWRPFPAAAPVLLRSRAPDEEPPAWGVRRCARDPDPRGRAGAGGRRAGRDLAVGRAGFERRDRDRRPRGGATGDDHHDLRGGAARQSGPRRRARGGRARGHRAPRARLQRRGGDCPVPEVIGVLESFHPPLVHSAVPNHLVARLASEHVNAVLVGEGADELFAGYSHYIHHDTGAALHGELLDTIAGMHMGGLQRVDRVTSANALEPRIPFLDLDVVELALALPPAWKLVTEARPAKWLLRRAFEGWLPDEVLWRRKEQFGEDTGMNDVLRAHFGATVSDEQLAHERDAVHPPLRTREELAYYRLFADRIPGITATGTIGRFAEA